MAKRKFTVDILVYLSNRSDSVKSCLQALLKYHSPSSNIILIGDKLSNTLHSFILGLCSKCRNEVSIGLLNNTAHLGYVSSINKHLSRGSSEYVVVIDDNVIVTKGWIEKLQSCIENDLTTGIVCPVTSIGFRQSVCKDLPNNFTIDSFADYISKTTLKKYPETTSADFCLFFRRELIQKVGNFNPVTFTEVDYCHRARQQGYKIVVADDTFIFTRNSCVNNAILDDTAFFATKPLRHVQYSQFRQLELPINIMQVHTLFPQEIDEEVDKVKSSTRVLIVIPVYNQLKYLKECVESIEKNTITPYNVLFVDDGSDLETTTWIRNKINVNHYLFVRNEQPQGFSSACNECIQFSGYDYYLFMNSDCKVETKNWIYKMQQALKERKSVVCGPLSNAAQYQSVPKVGMNTSLPLGVDSSTLAYLVESLSTHQHPYWHLIHGFCFLIDANIFKKYRFDQSNFPHYGSEDDMMIRLHQDGYKGCLADDVYVHHYKCQSYTSTRRKELVTKATNRIREIHGDTFSQLLDWTKTNDALSSLRKNIERHITKLVDITKIRTFNSNEYDIVVEIPQLRLGHPTEITASGGVKRLVETAYKLQESGYRVHLRIQKDNSSYDYNKLNIRVPWSVGLPDVSFPGSTFAISFADTKYGYLLSRLPQVKHKILYTLNWGMCMQRERSNVCNPVFTKIATTQQICKFVEAEGQDCYWVGFNFDTDKYYHETQYQRERSASLMYHSETKWKQYPEGVSLCNKLLKNGIVNKIITFGIPINRGKHIHPAKCEFYPSCGTKELREIFSRSSVYIMPSRSEGVNRTPIEATLCGCPSIVFTGALNELYINGKTCFISPINDFENMYKQAVEAVSNWGQYGNLFNANMRKILKDYTWDNNISRIIDVMNGLEKR